eukprot:114154_1
MGASDSIPQQIEGASDSIRTWVKDRNIALSKDALGKLKQNGFETIKDLEYCSVQDIEVLAKQKMHIKSSDRQKLNKVMQILTAADNHKNTFVSPQPNEVITLMGSPGYNEEEVDEDTHISREGVTLMGSETQSGYIESEKQEDHEDLFIGNLHKLSDRQYASGKTAHRWELFISASKDELIRPQSIKQVTYYLHPSFKPSIFTVKNTPFTLGKTGWGWFQIKAKIEFYEKSKRKNIVCAHWLNFQHKVTLTHINEHNSVVIDETGNPVIDCNDFYNDDKVDIHHSNRMNKYGRPEQRVMNNSADMRGLLSGSTFT